jgi:hypothetical protein
MPKLDNDKFIEGQNSFARGVGLRALIEQVENIDDDPKSASLLFGYLDGVFASIRRIDNLLMFPKGPDG